MLKILDKASPVILFALGFSMVLILGFLDYMTGNELSFYIFYFLPIALVSWYLGRKVGVIFVILCIVVWFLAHYYTIPAFSSGYVFFWNMIMRLFVFLTISLIIDNLKINIQKVHSNELGQQKKDIVLDTSQRMVGVIAEYISTKNSEIINWVNQKKQAGKEVPAVVDSASRSIANCLHALTQIFYTDLFDEKKMNEEDYVDHLKEKLSEVQGKYAKEDEHKS